jgi:hypothetical protein
MSSVTIEPINALFTDSRGVTNELANDRPTALVLCYRNKDVSCGKHYHTGSVANKNPEIIYLIRGEVELHWYNINDPICVINKEIVKSLSKITIGKYVWHELYTLSDCIFLELNSISDGKIDCVKVN